MFKIINNFYNKRFKNTRSKIQELKEENLILKNNLAEMKEKYINSLEKINLLTNNNVINNLLYFNQEAEPIYQEIEEPIYVNMPIKNQQKVTYANLLL